MAPNATSATLEQGVEQKVNEKPKYKKEIVWFNVFLFVFLHSSFLLSIYLGFTSANWKTVLFAGFYAYIGGFGVTVGCHRLWCHRSYKAKWPLRLFLCMLSSIACQNDIYQWCRDHRVHHKFTETDADPHNIKRGAFFAHMGWLMCRKHPQVTEKGKTVYMDDLMADPIVRFQKKFYFPIAGLFGFLIPTAIPVWFWGESLWNAFFIAGMGKYCLLLHITWCVNSVAHLFGDQPYDQYIAARENSIIAFMANGEGWHNYHHVFPWDYSTSELGYTLNLSKLLIDIMAYIGQAYDLKSAHPDAVNRMKLKSGDGTRLNFAVNTDTDITEQK